jgi:hypothetical protein
MLRSCKSRREERLGAHVPDPIVTREDDPEHEALLADSVGLALLSVSRVHAMLAVAVSEAD